jgi:hypothetical protein
VQRHEEEDRRWQHGQKLFLQLFNGLVQGGGSWVVAAAGAILGTPPFIYYSNDSFK